MRRFLTRAIASIENAPLTLTSFVMAFFALIIARLLVESSLGLYQEHSFFFFFFEFTHTFFFFLCSFLLLVLPVRFAGRVSLKQSANILLFGFLIILTPPIIDTFIFHGAHFWSFYAFDGFTGLLTRYITFFGDSPDIGITYGVRVEVALVTLALGLYTYIKARSVQRALLVAWVAYTILFILGTLPSWLTLGILTFHKGFLSISASDVAALFLTPENIFSRMLSDFRSVLNVKMSIVYSVLATILMFGTLFHEYPTYGKALWKNIRLPQIFYHGGLLSLGMLLAFFFTDAPLALNFFHFLGVMTLLLAVECAWIASVIANDCFDKNTDRITNQSRPLIAGTIPDTLYKTLGVIFFILSLLFSGIMSFSACLLLLSYQALAWLYSAPPLRLKRFPLLATLLAASAGILVLNVGFLVVSPESSLQSLPLPLLLYLFLAYIVCLPIKDFKDIAGDKADRVYTLPVLLGAKRAQLILGGLTFLMYALSPLVLNARSLFFFALLFGSLAFWTIQKGEANEKLFFSFRKLPGILLGITALYGIIVVITLF